MHALVLGAHAGLRASETTTEAATCTLTARASLHAVVAAALAAVKAVVDEHFVSVRQVLVVQTLRVVALHHGQVRLRHG